MSKGDAVNNPGYYGGKENPYEAIKIILNCNLGFCLGNSVKYILRAGKKDLEKEAEDLEKAKWYLQKHIDEINSNRELAFKAIIEANIESDKYYYLVRLGGRILIYNQVQFNQYEKDIELLFQHKDVKEVRFQGEQYAIRNDVSFLKEYNEN